MNKSDVELSSEYVESIAETRNSIDHVGLLEKNVENTIENLVKVDAARIETHSPSQKLKSTGAYNQKYFISYLSVCGDLPDPCTLIQALIELY